jgi:plastocyanin
MKRLTLVLGSVALVAVLTACSSGSTGSGTPAPVSSGAAAGDVSIVAKDLKFAPTEVSVKAGAPFSIAFANQEGVPHNIQIKDASGASVFKGDIITSTTITYAVPALAAGTYPFVCEVHPDMTGTITAQ